MFRFVLRADQREKAIILNANLTRLSTFGCHENYTIRCSGSINCRRSRIFQYGYGLNIIRIDIIEALLHSID